MGKKDDESEEQPDSENKQSSEENKNIEETKEENEEQKEKKKEEETEKLRKVIKVDDESKKDNEDKEENELDTDTSSREGLEQKRAVLQSIKDFDFQIKKNQEEITGLNKKLDSVSKDLDDLVSLYEIVSEQMNPFVGLSKVTKKRIDALENFTHEIEVLKERTGELESFAERSGAKLKSISEGDISADTIDTDEILEGTDIDENEGAEIEELSEETPENKPEETGEEDSKDDSIKDLDKKVEITKEVQNIEENNMSWDNFSDEEIDRIIEMSLGNLSIDSRINMIIDDFIENLKG